MRPSRTIWRRSGAAIKASLAHPEGRGRGTSLRTALQRNELLLLERYDTREKDWVIGGFVEFHMRVDDTLTLRDLGTIGEAPHAGVAKHLIGELFNQLGPASATCVVRRDAEAWNEILASDPRLLRRWTPGVPSPSLLQHLEVVAGAGSTGTAWRSPSWRVHRAVGPDRGGAADRSLTG